jgi:hypothetical protein
MDVQFMRIGTRPRYERSAEHACGGTSPSSSRNLRGARRGSQNAQEGVRGRFVWQPCNYGLSSRTADLHQPLASMAIQAGEAIQAITSLTPTSVSVAARMLRKSASGALAERKLPIAMPGSDPTRSDSSIDQSIDPSSQ